MERPLDDEDQRDRRRAERLVRQRQRRDDRQVTCNELAAPAREIAAAPGVLPISLDTASQWIRNARGMLDAQ